MAASLWAFPPPAMPTFFNNSYLSINILTYLNTSAAFWPAVGFGKTATYQNDQMSFVWPDPSAPNATRNWHCMPCRQKLESKDEALNWDACRYGINENLPELLTITVSLYQGQHARGYNLNQQNQLPESAKDNALMCTFGIPDGNPYTLTQPFRFVNTIREKVTGESTYVFNASAPEGNPMSIPPAQQPSNPPGDPQAGHYDNVTGMIVGAIVGSVAFVALLAVGISCCTKRRKNKKAADPVAEKDDLSKEEEAAGDALPSYEGPPAYVERVDVGTQK